MTGTYAIVGEDKSWTRQARVAGSASAAAASRPGPVPTAASARVASPPGRDFSQVRIHALDRAASSGRRLLQRCGGTAGPCSCGHEEPDREIVQRSPDGRDAPPMAGSAPSGLRIGAADDARERQADQMSAVVMAAWDRPGPDPVPRPAWVPAGTGAATGAAELRAQPWPDGTGPATLDVESYVATLDARAGRPLPDVIRRQLEPRFGRDFASVRIHADSGAAASSRAVRARAFTAGEHIVFGSGEYAPETRRGQALLVHELAHVAQQSAAAGTRGTAAPPAIRRMPWGVCPPGERLPGNSPFRYTAAELGMVAYYRVAGGSNCWSSNVDKFWEMTPCPAKPGA